MAPTSKSLKSSWAYRIAWRVAHVSLKLDSVKDIIREAPAGQFLRYLTNNRILLYPEEKADFELSEAYRKIVRLSEKADFSETSPLSPSRATSFALEFRGEEQDEGRSRKTSGEVVEEHSSERMDGQANKGAEEQSHEQAEEASEEQPQAGSEEQPTEESKERTIEEPKEQPEQPSETSSAEPPKIPSEEPPIEPSVGPSEAPLEGPSAEPPVEPSDESSAELAPRQPHEQLEKSENRLSQESNRSGERLYDRASRSSQETDMGHERPSALLQTTEINNDKAEQRTLRSLDTTEGPIVVGWYDDYDSANPTNWSNGKRALVAILICLYTFAVYAGSAIYTSAVPEVMKYFQVSEQQASFPLSLYVLAYGLGPMIFGPMSEIPSIGRNPVYAITFAIFVVLCAPTALADSFGGLLALRFLQGFFGSPCLANGGASMQDLYSDLNIPYAMTVWVSAAFAGPALGPLLSGYVVSAQGWRWSLWEILWIAGPVCLFFQFLLAETHAPTILLRRAQRLRKLTGCDRYKAACEIEQAHMTPWTLVVDALIKPIEISIKDPAVGFANLYTSLIYGIYYSFFVVFPLVYPPLYSFNLGQLGVIFVSIIIASIIGAILYTSYIYFSLNPSILRHGPRPQEYRLKPALLAVFAPPIGLFLFGWTAKTSISWVVPTIGIIIYSIGNFVILQCLSIYIPKSYPKYSASMFAANDLCRSAFAAGAIHFSQPLYENLGVAKGCSLLAGLSCMGIGGMFFMYMRGAKMRANSKFAVS